MNADRQAPLATGNSVRGPRGNIGNTVDDGAMRERGPRQSLAHTPSSMNPGATRLEAGHLLDENQATSAKAAHGLTQRCGRRWRASRQEEGSCAPRNTDQSRKLAGQAVLPRKIPVAKPSTYTPPARAHAPVHRSELAGHVTEGEGHQPAGFECPPPLIVRFGRSA